MIKTLLGMSFW